MFINQLFIIFYQSKEQFQSYFPQDGCGAIGHQLPLLVSSPSPMAVPPLPTSIVPRAAEATLGARAESGSPRPRIH